MKRFKGIIALDIDGTITAEKHVLEKNVATFLNQLAKEGWQLLFLTGRTLAFTQPILSTIEATYYLAVENGAALYKMPKAELFSKHFITIALLPALEKIAHAENLGLLLNSGGDKVYYKQHEHTKEERAYIDYRISFSPESFVSCKEFSDLKLKEFSLAKFFAHKEQAFAIQKKIAKQMADYCTAIVLRDPFREEGYIVHINAKSASKKEALLIMKEQLEIEGPIIAAGDDLNDESMLAVADVKIVMEDAPKELQAMADIIAPVAEKEGIITGIERALARV